MHPNYPFGFLVWAWSGALLWCSTLIGLDYALGEGWEKATNSMHQGLVIGGMLVLAVLLVPFLVWRQGIQNLMGGLMTFNRGVGLLLVAALFMSACSELGILPTSTRNGKVYDILIMEEGPQPVDLVVGIGDEVRFRNERTKPSYVLFFRDFRDEMSCERGFKMLWGTEEQAKIEPGDSASLCFNRTGTVGYKVQFDYTDFGGIGGTPGEINVPPGHPGAIIVK